MFLAYIDPVSGSILIQLIIAGIAGVGMFFRRSLKRIFCSWKRSDKPEETNASDESANDAAR